MISQALWSLASLVAEMATGFQEGKEYSLEDQAEWSAVQIPAGTVIEVDWAGTDRASEGSGVAASFIKNVNGQQ